MTANVADMVCQPSEKPKTSSPGFQREDDLLWRSIKRCIVEDERSKLRSLFEQQDGAVCLKLLMTRDCDDGESSFEFEDDVYAEANELLGVSVKNLNALHLACLLGHEDIALEILQFVSIISREMQSTKITNMFLSQLWGSGNTCLHLAAFFGMKAVIKRLIEMGMNPNKRNRRNMRAVDCADATCVDAFIGLTEVVRYRDEVKAMEIERTKSSISNTSTLISDLSSAHSTSPASKSTGTARPLRVTTKKRVTFEETVTALEACREGDTARVCSYFRNSGKNVDEQFGTKNWTFLHIAASYGHLDIVMWLVQYLDADVNLKDKEGWTPLHCASAESFIPVVAFLCSIPAIRVDELTEDGETAVDVADPKNQEQIKNILNNTRH